MNIFKKYKDNIYVKKAIIEKLDASVFFLEEFEEGQCREIYYGLKQKVNVLLYAKAFYTEQKMRNLREGLLAKIDINLFNDPNFEAGKMQAIKESIINNVYLPVFAKLNHDTITYACILLKEGIDKDFLSKFWN